MPKGHFPSGLCCLGKTGGFPLFLSLKCLFALALCDVDGFESGVAFSSSDSDSYLLRPVKKSTPNFEWPGAYGSHISLNRKSRSHILILNCRLE